MSDDMNPDVEEVVAASEPTEAPLTDDSAAAFPLDDENTVVEDEVLDELMSPEGVAEAPEFDPEPENTVDRAAFEQILRRDNVPQEVIDSLDSKTAREWSERAGKRQSDVDQYSNRLREMEDRLQPAQQAEGGQPSQETGANIPDSLRDIVGDEAAETVHSMIAERAAEATKQAVQQISQQQQQRAVAQHIVTQIETADQQTRTQYGDNAPSKEAVITEMSRLGRTQPKSFESVGSMLTQAYQNLAGNPPVQRKPSKRQPSAPKSQPRRPERAPENIEDAALDVLMSGGSAEDVHRRLRT